MGCGASKNSEAVVGSSMVGGSHKDEPMTNSEIESRIECIERTESLVLGGMKIRYAYLSQRGYYPDGKKSNFLSYILV
jgi:hypothetical protein